MSDNTSTDNTVVEKTIQYDPAKTQERCEHYMKKFLVWDKNEGWIPFDPSSIPPPPPPEAEDADIYFRILVKYQNATDTRPTFYLANCSQALSVYFRTTVGGVWFNDAPEYPVTSSFTHIDDLRKALKQATEYSKADFEKDHEEIRDFLKTLDSNDINEDTPDATLKDFLATFTEHFTVLMKYIEAEYKTIADQLELVTSYGHIEYRLLQYFFRPGMHILTTDRYGREIALVINNRYYDTYPPQFKVIGTGKTWDGENYEDYTNVCEVNDFRQTRPLATLPFSILTDEAKERLRERGKLYTSYTGVHYRTYHGDRVIVDQLAYNSQSGYTRDPNQIFPELPDSDLHLLPSEVNGFNFNTKDWESFFVTELQPVVFDDNAWDHLVLEPDVKTVIKGLVEVTKNANTSSKTRIIGDVISGKGGGLIAVLHGPPGTGKTLTAEAVAEILHRPLYMVGSSQLPSSASRLESSLKTILSLATAWDAVLLIDEADVYLEQRSLHELDRNALVSVALRLLEYHRGVLFLTTNRIKTFDEAFLSRFSIAIKYPELDAAARCAVWCKFLDLAGCLVVSETNGLSDEDKGRVIDKGEVDKLAEKEFNGRTIKNLVRTAQALALSMTERLALKHIMVVVRAQEKFLEQFALARTQQ